MQTAYIYIYLLNSFILLTLNSNDVNWTHVCTMRIFDTANFFITWVDKFNIFNNKCCLPTAKTKQDLKIVPTAYNSRWEWKWHFPLHAKEVERLQSVLPFKSYIIDSFSLLKVAWHRLWHQLQISFIKNTNAFSI